MVQGAGLDEGWIQEEVLFQAGGKVSKKFRIALAKFVDNPDVVIETAKLVEKYLIVDDPRNDAAQVLLIKNAATETDTRGLLEAVLIERSSEVLCELLGIPQSNISANRSGVGRPGFGLPGIGGRNLGPGGFSQRPQPFQRSAGNRFGADRSNRTGRKSRLDQSTDTEETVVEHDPDKRMRQQVVLLWRPQVAKMLRKSMMSNDFKGVNTQIPLLLGTIPLKSSRSALSEILQTSSDKGPTEWFSMGLFGSTTIDPALLVYGKRQYHQSGGRGPTGGKEGRVGGSVATWPDQIERYVADLCERFHGAQHISNTEEEPISVSKLPVRIHRRANIVARYDLHWPEGVGKKWKRFDIAPLELHYLRFEEEDVANKIIFHYRHHNKDAREVGLSNGVWFDRFDESEQLSVDIRITVPDGGGLGVPVGRELNNRNGRSQAGAGKTKFERKRLVIEVLTVNISTSEAEEGS